jgi:hypothetical protein
MKLRRGSDPDGERIDVGGHRDDLIELTRVSFIAEAVAIQQDLERIGVAATVFASDAGGWAPHFGIEQGQRVMIHARDLVKAREILSDVGGQLAVEPEPLSSPVRKHLRHFEAN